MNFKRVMPTSRLWHHANVNRDFNCLPGAWASTSRVSNRKSYSPHKSAVQTILSCDRIMGTIIHTCQTDTGSKFWRASRRWKRRRRRRANSNSIQPGITRCQICASSFIVTHPSVWWQDTTNVHLQKRRYTCRLWICVTTLQTPHLYMCSFHSRTTALSWCPLVCFRRRCVWPPLTTEKQ